MLKSSTHKNTPLAKNHYLKAKDYFEKAYKERLDFVYLDFLGNAAEFFSKNNEPQYALTWSKQGLDYISKVNGRSSMPGFSQVLNQGRVYYNLGDFQNALNHAKESLAILDERIHQAESEIDSIRIYYDKPQSILLAEKSHYELNPAKTISSLDDILNKLLDAVGILDRRKRYLSENEDLTVLVAQNEDLMDFVPGFTDSMKDSYLNSVKDSLSLDKAYLSLLPQPFTIQLANKATALFGGKSYMYEQSTPEVFRDYAGNNKIIHIATHAESNNLSPAFSRVIFAKSDKAGEDNSVYAFEIYDTEMKAHLTVLTACETGKPIYKPGEGMISLAHAFQYSGSESLLTSLWRIDEKSSMEITEYFLSFLAEGMAKDKALKQAKLKYLPTAKGRTLSPQYWAGLVLIGDPEPIEGLESTGFWIVWIFTLFALSIFVAYLLRRKRGMVGNTSE